MAVPSYTEDLTDIDLAETTTGYVAYGGGGAGLAAGPDFAMQGTNCVDKQVTAAEKGALFDNGAGITMGAGDHTFIWHFTATPGVTDTLVNRGAVVNVGNSSANFVKYHVEGSDTFGAGGRVGKCYVVDQTVQTSNTGSVPYRTLVGTPNGTLQVFGSGLKTIASVKSANMGLDATRYGTGAYITAGDATTPATFDGFAVQSDAVANRWGILTDVGGAYELQGYFVVGQNNAGTATQAYFEDNDVVVNLVDTVHSAIDFTRFIFDHASTEAYWTNITINALGTNNPGYLEVLNTSTILDIAGGAFLNFGKTTLAAACSADGTTWRGAGQITMAGATLANCNVETSTNASAVLCNSKLDDITDTNFIGDGTGHAVELTSLGTGTMQWDNTFDTTTYATVDGSTGNETIYVNVATGTLTINVGTGYTTPTIRTAGAIVTVVAGQLTTLVTVEDLDTNLPIENANVLLEASDNTGDLPYKEAVVINRTGSVATVTHTAHNIPTGKKAHIRGADDEEYNGVKVITVTGANSYTYAVTGTPITPATGTITSTGVIIKGLTDVNGEISDTRAVTLNTPVSGWARKSTLSPFYQQGNLTGEIDSAKGLAVTSQLISDE